MDASTPSDEDLAARCLTAMGHETAQLCRLDRLAGAGSGSGVFRLVLRGEDPAVLKVTVGRSRDHARRELAFYRTLAAHVPVRTPRLLDAADTDELTCLLLSPGRPAPPAAAWTDAQWVTAATQLGALHRPAVAAKAGGHAWLTTDGWPTSADGNAQTATIRRDWHRLGQAHVAEPLLDDLDRLGAALADLPGCLLHGDAHAANVLLDAVDTDLVWTDWQAVGFGYGPEDLALLWQRAEFDGARPPRAHMVDAYVEARGLADDEVLRRATIAAEARLILFGWPSHLLRATPERRQTIVGQLAALADQWHGRSASPQPGR